MSVIDEEDRYYAARVKESPDGWPFDANRDDPLTAHRIAVTGSHPRWCYLVAFDRESEARPTEHEVALLASFLEQYKAHWYRESYRASIERRPLDVDGGANGVVFHKWGENDWGYRRHSHTMGPLFFPGAAWYREKYAQGQRSYGLADLMDHIYTFGDDAPIRHWVEWKAAHPETFGEVEALEGAEQR